MSKEVVTIKVDKSQFVGSGDDFLRDLEGYAVAALHEYSESFWSHRGMVTASQAQVRRLYLLVKHVHDGVVPDESTVARCFGITVTASRALIARMLAVYHAEFNDALVRGCRDVLETAFWHGVDDDSWQLRFRVKTHHEVEFLRMCVTRLPDQGEVDPDALNVLKIPRLQQMYTTDFETYERLCDYLKANSIGEPQQ